MDILFGRGYKKIHFVGVLGSSMSALAILTKGLGYEVSGSDNDKNYKINGNFDKLKSNAIDFFCCHNTHNVFGADVVVYSSSIKFDNCELICAIQNQKCLVERGKFLGILSKQFKNVIAISGAHGKTTAGGLVADIFHKLKNASFHIGGTLVETNSACKLASREFFVTEACEYMSNFLSLSPSVSVILNIEFDHPDYFSNLKSVHKTFEKFAKRSQNLILNVDCENCKKLLGENSTTISCQSGDYVAKNIVASEDKLKFDIVFQDKTFRIETQICGDFNVTNILSAFAVSDFYGLDLQKVVEIINNHKGVARRSQKVLLPNKKVAILDYAHHPTQVFSMIKYYKNKGKLLCIFEPHTYSRTKTFLKEFSKALSCADEVILMPIFSAREREEVGILENLAKKIKSPCKIMNNSKEILEYSQDFCGKVLFLGAGNIDKLFSNGF